MRAMLDTIEFEQQEFKMQSWERESVDRSAADLDGVVSIDMGLRDREIVQCGVVRAVSSAGLKVKLSSLSRLMDGETHTLSVDGETYRDLLVDSFTAGEPQHDGSGVRCRFEIRYKQLRDL